MKRITLVMTTALLVGHTSPAAAYTLPGQTMRLSVSAVGNESEADSEVPVVSADGNAVAFWSRAPLVPSDTNGLEDVYVRDLVAGTIERVSVATDGTQATTNTLTQKTPPAISGDGRLVAFEIGSAELVPGDTNGVDDVFLHDRGTGETRRMSTTSTGAQLAWHSAHPSLSQDGRYLFFFSEDDTIVAGDQSPYIDIFRRDLQTGVIELVSKDSSGRQSVIDPSSYSINASGSIVAWSAKSPTFVVPDTNAVLDDVFVRDLTTGVTERVSQGVNGGPANHASVDPVLSGDGRYVAFASLATNLVPDDSNDWVDVFVHDRITKRTERVSVNPAGEQASQGGGSPAISDDGRSIVFNGISPDLSATPDGNGSTDVYLHDFLTGSTSLVSVSAAGAASGDAISFSPTISAIGRVVAFQSEATDMVTGDENFHDDVFARDMGPRHGVGQLTATTTGGGTSVGGVARFTGSVAQAADSAADATVQARTLGGEIIAGRLAFRPEEDDLFFRLDLLDLPTLPGSRSGVQGLVYTMAFSVKNVNYQLRLAPAAGAAAPISVRRCAPTCTEIGTAEGSLGQIGAALTASVPLSLLGIPADARLVSVNASTSLSGALNTSGDALSLPEIQLGAPAVQLGVAPAETPAAEVAFDRLAELTEGRFAADLGSVPAGHRVWARACVGSACSDAASIGGS